ARHAPPDPRCHLLRASVADHLRVDRYGDFVLTAAVRPGRSLPVIPRQGFRRDHYAAAGRAVPVLVAAATRDVLFDLFLSLLDPLGEVGDVVLETSHDKAGPVHDDLTREGIELPVLASHLCEHEELLLNDGCTGVAVVGRGTPAEVQFDEHKLFVVYADDLGPFEAILSGHGVEHVPGLRLITEGEHLHHSGPGYRSAFGRLAGALGVGAAARTLSW
ncbi:MAG: hypothetical protein ACRC33_18185, partial [Gemmataceae bacterium]